MKGQAETATGKRQGDLKENRPENVQDHHHYPHLPHVVPREAEHPSASQDKVPKIHNDRILLQAEICLAKVNTRMPRVAPIAAIIPPISTIGNLPDGSIDHLGNAIKQIAVHIGLFQCQDQHGDNSCDVDRNSTSKNACKMARF